ncbi:hypothetical protein C5L14_24140 [Labrys okinawensis]|uniref:DUF4129 domain-containing protein n=1 Tax=Labrys okinawensis TaxID=346911 RepID=A0A2S9Q6V6_9HYPH|nr:hypothetical protein [Labrys okinawensis]PRH85034.1 hypothetical protein C5L14_24140 [Labrys okinawensis]
MPAVAGLAVLLALTPAIPAVAASDPQAVARDVARNLGLQPDLPGNKGEVVTPKTEPKPDERAPRIWSPWLGTLLSILLYAAIAAGLIFAIWTMRDRLPVLGRRKLVARVETDVSAQAASVERMVVAQIEADELARQGRLAEAMHALLLRSLIEVRKRLNVSFADSLTSREILRALSLPDRGKQALADIIGRVEPVYFGESLAEERDYAACRQSYEILTEAMQARAA